MNFQSRSDSRSSGALMLNQGSSKEKTNELSDDNHDLKSSPTRLIAMQNELSVQGLPINVHNSESPLQNVHGYNSFINESVNSKPRLHDF